MIIPDIVEKFIEHAKQVKCFAFDIEHPPYLHLHQAGFKLHGCSFSTDTHTFYVKEKEMCLYITNTLFSLKEIEAVAFNGKYDIQCLIQSGWATKYPEILVDPMIALNLLDDNKMPNQLGLKENIFELFGHKMMHFEQASAFGMDSQQFTQYACDDSLWEFRLWQRLKPELEHQGLLKYFQCVPAVKFFADVETAGVLWDLQNCRNLLRDYIQVRDTLEEEIYKEIGVLNLSSPKQLQQRLFEELGYSRHGLKQTSKGETSTDADNMELLAKRYPICSKIVKFRTASKMIGTYIVPLSQYALEAADHRVHPKFWLVSSTGRTRCSDPNLQNIPAHLAKDFKYLDIRQMFIAQPGYKFVVVDYSQIELRVMAHFSKDPAFLQAFRDWQCTSCNKKGTSLKILHKCPNCGCAENDAILKDKSIKGFWHGLDLHQLTADNVPALKGNRQGGKMANFALIYAAGAMRMNAEYPEFSVDKWQDIIDDYFQTYSAVKHWHKHMEQVLMTQHKTRDIFGRLRRIHPFLIKKSFKHALNQIVNFPVQGSAAGIIQLASTKFRKLMIDKGYWMKQVIVVNSIHDETDLEIREDVLEETIPIIKDCFENIISIEVPLRVDCSVGDDWHDAKG